MNEAKPGQLMTAPLEGTLMHQLVLEQDLSCLSDSDKVQYVIKLCNSLGLNYLTKPFQLLKTDGKLKLYATKDATEQLRKINSISITKLESEILDKRLCIVKAHGILPDGRTDMATGVTYIENLKGDLLANAFMKAETKAKRRLTLSISGLGILDESEVESIKGSQKIHINYDTGEIEQIPKIEEKFSEAYFQLEHKIKHTLHLDQLIEIGDTLKTDMTIFNKPEVEALRKIYKNKHNQFLKEMQDEEKAFSNE